MEEEVYDFIASASYMKEIKPNIKTGGGGYDMCKAIADMIQDGRSEGWSDGEREGKKEAIDIINLLNSKLLQDNRQEDILRSITDPEFQKKLLAEYALEN